MLPCPLTSPAPYAVPPNGIWSDAAADSTLGMSFSVVPTCSNLSIRLRPNCSRSSAHPNQHTRQHQGSHCGAGWELPEGIQDICISANVDRFLMHSIA